MKKEKRKKERNQGERDKQQNELHFFIFSYFDHTLVNIVRKVSPLQQN